MAEKNYVTKTEFHFWMFVIFIFIAILCAVSIADTLLFRNQIPEGYEPEYVCIKNIEENRIIAQGDSSAFSMLRYDTVKWKNINETHTEFYGVSCTKYERRLVKNV